MRFEAAWTPRCRAIAATMPMLPHNDEEQTHLALLADSGAICESELLRLVETAEVLRIA